MKRLIANARLLTMTPDSPEHGYLLIEDGVIVRVGHGDCPSEEANGAMYFDAFGRIVMPGFIDCHCHIGLCNAGLRWEGDDVNEVFDPVTPELSALDGVFPDDLPFADARRYGVTSVMTGPGSANIIGGSFSLMHTAGVTADAMVITEHAAMKAALGENPKGCYGQGLKRSPATRMASAALMRKAFDDALWYRNQREAKPSETKPDAKYEALLPVLSGERLLKVHVHRMDDILTAVRVCDHYGLRFTLDHCTEGYRVADTLKAYYDSHQGHDFGVGIAGKGKLVGLVTGPLITDRSKPELARMTIDNPARLAETGIPLAIATDHPVVPIECLPLSAALAVRAGLPESLALRAITTTAAAMADADHLIGRLAPGYWADVLVLSGDPLDVRTTPDLVLIGGDVAYERRG